jgi:hypothetical protein
MSSSCPIILRYLRRVRATTYFQLYLHEPLLDELKRIEQAAFVAGDSATLQQLRCFTCLELMCCMCSSVLEKEALYDRSWSGLRKLGQILTTLKEDIDADAFEYDLMREGTRPPDYEMRKAKAEKLREQLKACHTASLILRRSLRNGKTKDLPLIAKLLADSNAAMNRPYELRVRDAQRLSQVTEEHAPHIWEES